MGARTLCNACGIRWKRLMGRAKRPVNRSKPKTPKPKASKPSPKPKSAAPIIAPVPQEKLQSPIQKPAPSQHPLVGRTTRANTRTTRNLLDRSAIASKNVLSLSQNELLDCILTRLEDLESSQTRTSLRVRVLTQRLMRQKQKQLKNKNNANSLATSPILAPSKPSGPISIVPDNLRKEETHSPVEAISANTQVNAVPSQGKDGDNEAFLLVSMRDITQLPYDAFKPLQTH